MGHGVSKEEYDSWTRRQETNLGNKISIDQRLTNDLQRRIIQLEHTKNDDNTAEITALRRINADLETRLMHATSAASTSPRSSPETRLFGELSRAYIEEEINKILANNNSGIIPDYYERMIYRNIFNMFFGLIENLTSNASLKFLHHTISFDITADSDVVRDISGNSNVMVDDDMVDAVE